MGLSSHVLPWPWCPPVLTHALEGPVTQLPATLLPAPDPTASTNSSSSVTSTGLAAGTILAVSTGSSRAGATSGATSVVAGMQSVCRQQGRSCMHIWGAHAFAAGSRASASCALVQFVVRVGTCTGRCHYLHTTATSTQPEHCTPRAAKSSTISGIRGANNNSSPSRSIDPAAGTARWIASALTAATPTSSTVSAAGISPADSTDGTKPIDSTTTVAIGLYIQGCIAYGHLRNKLSEWFIGLRWTFVGLGFKSGLFLALLSILAGIRLWPLIRYVLQIATELMIGETVCHSTPLTQAERRRKIGAAKEEGLSAENYFCHQPFPVAFQPATSFISMKKAQIRHPR